MTFLEATSSGVVQGVTEFLPVSSSGHLVLLHALFGFEEPKLLFDLCLHLGTTVSVLILCWPKIFRFLTTERKLFFFVVLGTLPTVAIGLFFAKPFEALFSRPKDLAWGFWMTAAWLFFGERFRAKKGRDLAWHSALLIGFSQGIAIIPAISRSGATIGTGLLLGLEGSVAVEYSFLLSIPAILGAFLYKLFSVDDPVTVSGIFGKEGVAFGVGTLIATLSGMIAIRMVHRIVQKRKLYFFSLYQAILGTLIFLYFWERP